MSRPAARPSSWCLAALVACALALCASPARADEPPKPRKAPKVAVLEIRATGTSDPKAATALSALIASEAGRFAVKVVAGSDLQNLIGFDKQKQLMGCTDSSCLAEIGGALGVDYLLTSEIGEFGGRFLLTLVLLDVSKSSPVQRVTRRAQSQTELVDTVGLAMAEVLQAFPMPKPVVEPEARPATVEPAKTEPAVEPATTEPQKPPEPLPAAATSAQVDPGRPLRIAGYTLIAAGGALLVGGAVSGILGKKQHDDVKAGLATTTPKALDDAKGSINAKLLIADALYAGGAIAAALGIVLVVTAPSPTSPRTGLQLVPVSSGGAIVVSGGF